MKTMGLCLAVATVLFGATLPGAAQETLTIGFTASQTGALNNDSTAQMRGFELWRDEVNAKGGIKAGGKTYKVKFVSYDDKSRNTRVQQLYTRLIVQDKAKFLFSPYSSGLVATGRDHFRAVRKDHGHHRRRQGEDLSSSATKTCSALLSGQPISRRRHRGAEEKDPKAKIAFVYQDDPFSKAVSQAAGGQAKKAGFGVVLEESYRGPPPISARSSTRSFRRRPMRCSAAAIMRTAPRWRARCMTRRRA